MAAGGTNYVSGAESMCRVLEDSDAGNNGGWLCPPGACKCAGAVLVYSM